MSEEDREKELLYVGSLGSSSGAFSADLISPFLSDEDPEVVGHACYYLGALGARNYIPQLADLLTSSNSVVVNMAGAGLSQMVDARDACFLPNLLVVLDHPELLARMSAIEAVGGIGSKDVTLPLIERLHSENPAAKWQIIAALGKIGDERALPMLYALLAQAIAMDHTVPNKGGTRGSVPHPDSFQAILEESISSITEVT